MFESPTATHAYEQPGEHIVLIRLVDDLGESHYGRAGLTVEASPCVLPQLVVSATKISVGQAVRIYDLSRIGEECQALKREYRRQSGASWLDLAPEGTVLLKYDAPGEYEVGLRIRCAHDFSHEANRLITVLTSPPPAPPPDSDFEIVGAMTRSRPSDMKLHPSAMVSRNGTSMISCPLAFSQSTIPGSVQSRQTAVSFSAIGTTIRSICT